MSVLEIELRSVRSAAVQLGAAATVVSDGAATLAQLRLTPEQAGVPDGAVVVAAVQRFAERASRRLAETGSTVRTHSVDMRDACAGYAGVDEDLATRLRTIR